MLKTFCIITLTALVSALFGYWVGRATERNRQARWAYQRQCGAICVRRLNQQ
jgi:membrane protein DedA with SNARE-associated domain